MSVTNLKIKLISYNFRFHCQHFIRVCSLTLTFLKSWVSKQHTQSCPWVFWSLNAKIVGFVIPRRHPEHFLEKTEKEPFTIKITTYKGICKALGDKVSFLATWLQDCLHGYIFEMILVPKHRFRQQSSISVSSWENDAGRKGSVLLDCGKTFGMGCTNPT